MLNIKQIVEATKGKLLNGNENTIIRSYKIDSREVTKNDFFIPIKGEKVDSHIFLDKVSSLEISGFFLEEKFYTENKKYIEEIINKYKNINIVIVNDSLKALYEIGKYNRSLHLDIPVIAVTGSVGKTSTKEMIANIFQTKYNVLKTYKNYNSYIGLSLMLLMLENQDIAILEHGIDVIGEMKLLSESSRPTYSVITNIGMSHIENFKSKENIAREKTIIANYTKEDIFINGDDSVLEKYDDSKFKKYYLSNISNLTKNNNLITYNVQIYNNNYEVKINEYGNHNILNSLVAIKLAEKFNIDVENILRGISNYRNFNKRFEVIKLSSSKILIDDTYNASYDSFKSGLESLESFNNPKIVILGDILETGEYAEELHRNVGKLFNYIKVQEVLTFGDNAKYINEESKKYIDSKHFQKKEEIVEYINSKCEKDLLLYFKASNGMKFSEIVDKIN